MAASNLNIQRAREIAAGSNSPTNQALGKTSVSPAVLPYIPAATQPTPSYLPPQTTNQAFPAKQNDVRTGGETPVGYVNGTVGETNNRGKCDGVCPYIPPIVDGKPNQDYVTAIPDPPPPRDPEKTESIIQEIVDEIIQESNDVIDEVHTHVLPGPQVIPDQDIIVAPPAITPTELVLQNQANCEDSKLLPEIIINNEVKVKVNVEAPSGSRPPIWEPPNIVFGCMDPDALNYNPDATVNDFTCVFEAPPDEPVDDDDDVVVVEEPDWDPPMPPEVPFLNSHGEVLYIVTKEDVKAGKMVKLPSGKKIKATIDFVNHITRKQTLLSDIVLTEEDHDVSVRKEARKLLGGKLPGDSLGMGETTIAVMDDEKEKLQKEVNRNPRGIIYIRPNSDPQLKISLRSRAFDHGQYTRTIDTQFPGLLGKME
jgi:hypothetical protein